MNYRTVLLGDIAKEDRVIVDPNSIEALNRPYLGLEQIESGTGHILSYDVSSAEGKSTTFEFDESHVLYGKLRPYLNKVALPNRPGRCSTEIIPLRPHEVDREFLALLLRSDRLVTAAMSGKTGSRMPRADMDNLFNLQITIPESREDQHNIACKINSLLATAEDARKTSQILLHDTHQLIKAILNQDFCTLTKVDKVPIGDLAHTTSGSTPSRSHKDFWSPAIHPWVKTSEVAFRPIVQTEESISDLALQECSLSLLPAGTVLVAMYGQGKTRGQSAVLQISATPNQACFAILPNESLDPYYLQLWLRHSYGTLRALSESRGGNQSNLNAEMLNAFEIPLLPLEEQRALASRLRAAIAEAESMQRLLAAKLSDIELLPSRILAQAFDS